MHHYMLWQSTFNGPGLRPMGRTNMPSCLAVSTLRWQPGIYFGDYLEGSGWTSELVEAGIASSGTADSFLRAPHLTRTRHAHQVTALALNKLQQDAFDCSDHRNAEEGAKEAWRQDMINKSPTFQYWDTILNMEILGLMFIRAHRKANCPLYVESIKALVLMVLSSVSSELCLMDPCS